MPNTCAAYGCNHRFGPETKQKGITFHLLPPATDIRRKLWIANSRRIDPVTRKPWDPSSKYVYFCSDHFMPADFENSSKPWGRRLKENAVPSVFTFPTVMPTSDKTSGKGGLPRPKKLKHRKVVMLPKKIKHLQETSASNVESVTIISFQHLGYNEKLQPMFEEAMLDLQYPEEAERNPEEEEEEEYYEDEYTELKDRLPPEEDEEIELPVPKDPAASEEMEPSVQMDCSIEVSEENPTSPSKLAEETVQKNGVGDEHMVTEESSAAEPEKLHSSGDEDEDVDEPTEPVSEEPVQKESRTKAKKVCQPVLSKVDAGTILKRKIPVVIKELSMIDDIEELRVKAFRIAEDNIKLKRQVIYLEQKLEEVLSEAGVK